jgi:hypothetical protein
MSRIRAVLGRLRDRWRGPPGEHSRHRHLAEQHERVWLPATAQAAPTDYGCQPPRYLRSILHPIVQRELGFPSVDAYIDHLFSLPAPSIPGGLITPWL